MQKKIIALAVAGLMSGAAFAQSNVTTLLFGFADALQIKLQILRGIINVPPQVFLALPYILTVIVLAGVMGRAVGPAAVGQPYKKG